jgi:hypothetical protein
VLGAGCFDSTGLRLFQYPDDLLLAKSPLHFVLLLLPEQNYTFQLSSFWGAGHIDLVVYVEFRDEHALAAFKADPLYDETTRKVRPLRELRFSADYPVPIELEAVYLFN